MQEKTVDGQQGMEFQDREAIETEMNGAFMVMRRAALLTPNPSWQARFVRLERLEALVLDNKERIEQAVCEDFGFRPDFVTEMVDVMPTITQIRYMKDHAEKWMHPVSKMVEWMFLPASAKIVPQPKGVVGIISPWNYPLLLSLSPVAQAFAAGNLCMLKLSEFTPNFSGLINELSTKYFLPDELVVFTGGADEGSVFSSLPFDHLLFTGSTKVGKLVAEAAARNLTPVTLELGGKSPAIIAPDYPVDHAAERIMYGKLLNSGQTCIAPDYVLIEQKNIKRFVESCRRHARKFYPEGLASGDYVSINSLNRFQRFLELLQDASGRCEVQSLFPGDQYELSQRKLAPQLLLNIPLDHKFMTEEIFGPILPVIPYHDEQIETAIEFVTAREHPLALYWFDKNKDRTANAVESIKSGGVTINDTIWHATQSALPFGGIGASGMGRYMGRAGFDTFSHLKPVFVQSRFSFVNMANPPYTEKFKSLVGKLLQTKEKSKDQAPER